ncbi:MAG: DUF5615 family PIN-like protein, partial [Calditrichota bacterium]
LCSAPDTEVIAICKREGKVIITLDLGFGNPFRFPPADYPGIIVLRPGRDAGLPDIIEVVRTAIEGLSKRQIAGKLWTVRKGRIREHRDFSEEI